MDVPLANAIVFSIIAVSLGSYLAVKSWSDARRAEREAFYRNDAIKKLAEMQGSIPEPLLELLQQSLNPKPEPLSPWPFQQMLFYKNESMKRIALGGPGAAAELELLRQNQQRGDSLRHQGLRMGGWILLVVGGSLGVFFRGMIPDQPVYLVALFPLLLGVIMLAYGYFGRGTAITDSQATSGH